MSIRSLCAAGATVLVFASAIAAPERSTLAALPLDELRHAYLHCDWLTSRSVVDFGTAASCSVAAEELLQRGHAGHFDELLAWWRSARTAHVPAQSQPIAAKVLTLANQRLLRPAAAPSRALAQMN